MDRNRVRPPKPDPPLTIEYIRNDGGVELLYGVLVGIVILLILNSLK